MMQIKFWRIWANFAVVPSVNLSYGSLPLSLQDNHSLLGIAKLESPGGAQSKGVGQGSGYVTGRLPLATQPICSRWDHFALLFGRLNTGGFVCMYLPCSRPLTLCFTKYCTKSLTALLLPLFNATQRLRYRLHQCIKRLNSLLYNLYFCVESKNDHTHSFNFLFPI